MKYVAEIGEKLPLTRLRGMTFTEVFISCIIRLMASTNFQKLWWTIYNGWGTWIMSFIVVGKKFEVKEQ